MEALQFFPSNAMQALQFFLDKKLRAAAHTTMQTLQLFSPSIFSSFLLRSKYSTDMVWVR
jgi:hypothetical protein